MRYVIGIDEVGRGSLAGPVVVSAVAIKKGLRIRNDQLGQLRDSKKLTAKRRGAWAEFIKSHSKIYCAVARVYPRMIEKINISSAANIAALRACNRLTKSHKLTSKTSKAYLDGGLYVGNGKSRMESAKTIIRGDQKINAIKLASIVAKVNRDRLMTRLAKKYPQYGFEVNKGYGTRAHLAEIKKHGPSRAHRLTFLK